MHDLQTHNQAGLEHALISWLSVHRPDKYPFDPQTITDRAHRFYVF
jgi:hypothetical protein